MHYLLLIGAFLFFAFIAPAKTTALFVGIALLISIVVKVSAQVLCNVSVTLGQSFRAVTYSLFFSAIAIFTMGSFSVGTGISHFTGSAGVAVLAALFFAYSLGFKVGLGTTIAASGGIAAVSSLVSVVLLWFGSKAG